MKLVNTAHALTHVLKWRLNWEKYDLDFKPTKVSNPKFLSARQATELIDNNAVCISSGMAGNARCSIFYWAIKEAFLTQDKPKDLTWITVSAQGGRGKAPGTIEELDAPGLIKKYVSGHLETAKSLLSAAEKGQMELHTLPQGEMAFLLQAQADGKDFLESETGVGTFLDPRTGSGSPVTPNPTQEYIKVSSKDPNKLEYRLPKIDVALFSAPYADTEGNIYFENASVITENLESTMAARKNNGKVLVAVSKIIEKKPDSISLAAEHVDAIVVNPWNEQAASIKQRKYWPMFTKGAKVDTKRALQKVRMVNRVMGITPKRTPVDNALSRMAADLFAEVAEKDSLVNLGIGLPEEVGKVLFEGGLHDQVICSSETGVYNGLPTPGVYFGGAINPQKIQSSAWMFNHYKENLDVTVLGLAQVDSKGNVNVSKTGPNITDYVGPGGFVNISECAKTIIFVGSWMTGGKIALREGALKLKQTGKARFVSEVDQVTFNGQQALKRNKKVFYVTNVGVFKLTKNGLELVRVAPGVNIQKDIIDTSGARIYVPRNKHIPVVPAETMTGKGFKLSL